MRDHAIDAVLGCHLWSGSVNSDGYPTVRHEGRVVLVRRLYYEQANGEIPPDTFLRCSCQRKRCVNPDHMTPTPRAVAVKMPRRRRPR